MVGIFLGSMNCSLICPDRFKFYQINVTCINLEVMREVICTVKLWTCKSIFLLIFTLVSAQRQIRPKPDLFPDTITLKNIFAELNKKSWQVLIFLFPHNTRHDLLCLYWFFRTSPPSPVVFKPPQHQFLQICAFHVLVKLIWLAHQKSASSFPLSQSGL